jgi:exodeoxyribonuclease V gamma subunit
MLIEGVFRHLTPAGMVLFRRARPGGRDHLKAWLWHLLLCAAPAHQLPPDMPRRTIWLGETDGFAFRPVEQAPARLAELLALYRVGHRWPLRFFPKSAWSRVSESAAAAQRVYEGGHDIAGEGEDRYLRIALRGLPSGLDAEFEALSELVMGPLREHLVADLEPMGTAS